MGGGPNLNQTQIKPTGQIRYKSRKSVSSTNLSHLNQSWDHRPQLVQTYQSCAFGTRNGLSDRKNHPNCKGPAPGVTVHSVPAESPTRNAGGVHGGSNTASRVCRKSLLEQQATTQTQSQTQHFCKELVRFPTSDPCRADSSEESPSELEV